jgi:hypothetical protein
MVNLALIGVPIEIASELAGGRRCDSIAITSIYSSRELTRKIKAVQAMRRRVLV